MKNPFAVLKKHLINCFFAESIGQGPFQFFQGIIAGSPHYRRIGTEQDFVSAAFLNGIRNVLCRDQSRISVQIRKLRNELNRFFMVGEELHMNGDEIDLRYASAHFARYSVFENESFSV